MENKKSEILLKQADVVIRSLELKGLMLFACVVKEMQDLIKQLESRE